MQAAVVFLNNSGCPSHIIAIVKLWELKMVSSNHQIITEDLDHTKAVAAAKLILNTIHHCTPTHHAEPPCQQRQWCQPLQQSRHHNTHCCWNSPHNCSTITPDHPNPLWGCFLAPSPLRRPLGGLWFPGSVPSSTSSRASQPPPSTLMPMQHHRRSVGGGGCSIAMAPEGLGAIVSARARWRDHRRRGAAAGALAANGGARHDHHRHRQRALCACRQPGGMAS